MPAIHCKDSKRKVQIGIDNLAPFDVASVHGTRDGIPWMDAGRMTGPTLERFKAEQRAGKIDFVVRHYATPVVWHTPDGWVVPEDYYSPSTTTTMGILRVMINNPGFYS